MAAGHLSAQGSLQSAAQLLARSAASSRHALWGRPLDGVNQTDEGDLARAALLALQAWRTVNILQCCLMHVSRLPYPRMNSYAINCLTSCCILPGTPQLE